MVYVCSGLWAFSAFNSKHTLEDGFKVQNVRGGCLIGRPRAVATAVVKGVSLVVCCRIPVSQLSNQYSHRNINIISTFCV